jgi:hypothetical protein
MVNRASIRQQVMKAPKKRKPKLGTGKRFKALTSKLSKKGALNLLPVPNLGLRFLGAFITCCLMLALLTISHISYL